MRTHVHTRSQMCQRLCGLLPRLVGTFVLYLHAALAFALHAASPPETAETSVAGAGSLPDSPASHLGIPTYYAGRPMYYAGIPTSYTDSPPIRPDTAENASDETETPAVGALMDSVFSYPERNGLKLGPFVSEIYARHTLYTRRRGIIMRYIPGMLRLERGTNTYFGESLARYEYRPPGEVYKKDIADYNTMPYLRKADNRWIGRFSLSVYEPNLFSDRMLSPLNRRNRRFYRYQLDSCRADSGVQVACVGIRPRFPNTQLVSGSIEVEAGSGRVRRFDFRFVYGWMHMRVAGDMEPCGEASLLAGNIRLESGLRFLGNRVNEVFEADARYGFGLTPAARADDGKSSRFDLTRQHMLRIDPTGMRTDRSDFDSLRPRPLEPWQRAIYEHSDSLRAVRADSAKPHRSARWLISPQAERFLFDSHSFILSQAARLKLPPLLTPAMVQWSHGAGLSLQTRIALQMRLGGGSADFSPRVGYNFRQRQVYWRLPLQLDVVPSLGAALRIEAAGGERMYNSRQADEVRERFAGISGYDSLLRVFDSYDFHYYRDNHLRADFSLSPVPGLAFGAGLRYHRRSLIHWGEAAKATGLDRRLESLAPRLYVEWTPAQYYYRDGLRRVPLYSSWPTFKLDYERGVAGLRGHTDYERIEADARYLLPLYALHSLYFRVGAGFYTRRGDDCFFDYDYFRHNVLPTGWKDELSGRFQLLDSRWYNESRYYARCSAAYESPMLIFSRLPFLSRTVQKERLYASLLSVHALRFYSEWGYGISTPLLDVATFVSLSAHGRPGIGCKVVFRLFED